MARSIPSGRLDALAATATDIFIAQGYRRTQMADVARAMGLAKGTLYGYAASKRVAVGARCEVHNFGADQDSIRAPRVFHGDNAAKPVDSERITTAGMDVYIYMNRTKETMYYLNFGAGIYQLAILQPEVGDPPAQSARIEKDKVYMVTGIGLEHFVKRPISFDLNGKLFAYFGDKDGLPVSFQLAAGLQFYFFD